jgi:hypothetical protein
VIETDEYGNSITPLKFERPDLKIIMTGGSTVFGVGVDNNQQTVPSQLEKLIYEKLNIKVEITNIGVRGYQSFQEMLNLHRHLQRDQYHMVLTLSGRNDAYMALQSTNTTFQYLPQSSFEISERIRMAEKGKIVVMGVQQHWMRKSQLFNFAYQGMKVLPQWFARLRNRPSEMKSSSPLFENIEQRVRFALDNYSLMSSLAKNHGAMYLMLLQPTAFSKKNLTNEEKLLVREAVSSSEEYSKYENIFFQKIENFVSEYHIPFSNLSQTLDPYEKKVYEDSCHYSSEGSALLAHVIFLKIKDNIIDLYHKKHKSFAKI